MNSGRTLLCAATIAGALLAGAGGCATDARVSGGAAIYYGPFSFWFHDGPWLNGHRWWHEGVVIHPPPIYVHSHGPGPHLPSRPRPRMRP